MHRCGMTQTKHQFTYIQIYFFLRRSTSVCIGIGVLELGHATLMHTCGMTQSYVTRLMPTVICDVTYSHVT